MIKRIIIHKERGNVTSLILGQMFMLVFLVWCMFSFRLVVLNTTFQYIDDALISSTLGAALINVEEYGKSNQIIISDSDAFENVTSNSAYNGWTKTEADILLSELNYGTNTLLGYNVLPYKQKLASGSREKTGTSYDYKYDYKMRKAISAFMGNFAYNLSNGKAKGTNNISAENIIANINGNASGALNSVQTTFNGDIITNSFLKPYIDAEGIKVNALQIHNVYRQTLALQHVYKSDFFTVNVNSNGVATGTTPALGTLTDEWFEENYMPDESDPNYTIEYELYKIKKQKFEKDRAVAQSGYNNLVCYVNTWATYQGLPNKNKVPYDFYYTKSNGPVSDTETLTAPDKLRYKTGTTLDKTLIQGHGVYSFNLNGASTSSSYNYKDISSTNQEIKLTDCKMEGSVIENSAVYTEIKFKIKTFPGTLGDVAGFQEVTLARLIDIEIAQ